MKVVNKFFKKSFQPYIICTRLDPKVLKKSEGTPMPKVVASELAEVRARRARRRSVEVKLEIKSPSIFGSPAQLEDLVITKVIRRRSSAKSEVDSGNEDAKTQVSKKKLFPGGSDGDGATGEVNPELGMLRLKQEPKDAAYDETAQSPGQVNYEEDDDQQDQSPSHSTEAEGTISQAEMSDAKTEDYEETEDKEEEGAAEEAMEEDQTPNLDLSPEGPSPPEVEPSSPTPPSSPADLANEEEEEAEEQSSQTGASNSKFPTLEQSSKYQELSQAQSTRPSQGTDANIFEKMQLFLKENKVPAKTSDGAELSKESDPVEAIVDKENKEATDQTEKENGNNTKPEPDAEKEDEEEKAMDEEPEIHEEDDEEIPDVYDSIDYNDNDFDEPEPEGNTQEQPAVVEGVDNERRPKTRSTTSRRAVVAPQPKPRRGRMRKKAQVEDKLSTGAPQTGDVKRVLNNIVSSVEDAEKLLSGGMDTSEIENTLEQAATDGGSAVKEAGQPKKAPGPVKICNEIMATCVREMCCEIIKEVLSDAMSRSEKAGKKAAQIPSKDSGTRSAPSTDIVNVCNDVIEHVIAECSASAKSDNTAKETVPISDSQNQAAEIGEKDTGDVSGVNKLDVSVMDANKAREKAQDGLQHQNQVDSSKKSLSVSDKDQAEVGKILKSMVDSVGGSQEAVTDIISGIPEQDLDSMFTIENRPSDLEIANLQSASETHQDEDTPMTTEITTDSNKTSDENKSSAIVAEIVTRRSPRRRAGGSPADELDDLDRDDSEDAQSLPCVSRYGRQNIRKRRLSKDSPEKQQQQQPAAKIERSIASDADNNSESTEMDEEKDTPPPSVQSLAEQSRNVIISHSGKEYLQKELCMRRAPSVDSEEESPNEEADADNDKSGTGQRRRRKRRMNRPRWHLKRRKKVTEPIRGMKMQYEKLQVSC